MAVSILRLQGTPVEIGRQHGRQIHSVRPLLLRAMEKRLAGLRDEDADSPGALEPVREALAAEDRPLWEFLDGLAEALALPFYDLFRYTLSSYLRDLHQVSVGPVGPREGRDGCTTWAASGPATVDQRPLLAKNRDYHLDHIPLQTLASVAPHQGYRFLCLGSAGSPHVFSSGMNERGLTVADTHVLSQDIGPGLPRFSLMREILQHHASTRSALDYLRSAPQMGAGTLVLADADGQLAVWESGHRQSGYVAPGQDFLVSTNHFVTQPLAAAWLEDEPPPLVGNSKARRDRVLSALAGATGQVDPDWAKTLMTGHGTLQNSLCRHLPADEPGVGHPNLATSTISSIIFFPAGMPGAASTQPTALLASGQPCQVPWQQWNVSGS